jgi:hypothetical protein
MIKKSKSKFYRNKKIIKCIIDNNCNQFVNADCGLIMSLMLNDLPYKKLKVNFNDVGYSELENNGKINVISPIDKEAFRIFQINMLKTMLKIK